MIDKKHFTTKSLVGSVTAINVLGNLLGVGLTFIYFGVLMPRLLHGSPIGNIGSTVGFCCRAVLSLLSNYRPLCEVTKTQSGPTGYFCLKKWRAETAVGS
jgi:hypothetical protein